MSKPRKKRGNRDFERVVTAPVPPSPEIEARIIKWLTPGTFVNLKSQEGNLRDRRLTLPVMAAIVMSLVYRKVHYLAEIVRVLEQEGLMGLEPQKVSKQALSKRLRKLPAELFLEMFNEMAAKIQQQPSRAVSQPWEKIRQRFSRIWIADGSTLNRLQKTLELNQKSKSNPLAGKMMGVVEAFSHRPVSVWYDENAQRSDQSWRDEVAEALPPKGLLVVDMGFFAFPWFEKLTEAKKFVITRCKSDVGHQVVRTLDWGDKYKDQMIQLGTSKKPCKVPMRLISVTWGTKRYRYLTNVLDPKLLSAQEICELYRRRWQVESAFLLTKRLLGLAYFWVGGTNGVRIQLYTTWIFYAVLNDLCDEVAKALNQPIERISVEMVFRSLYHYSQACVRDASTQLIPYLVEHSKSLGLVKAVRKRQRNKYERSLDVWGSVLS